VPMISAGKVGYMGNLFANYGKYRSRPRGNRLIVVGKKVPLGARSSGAEGFFRSCGFFCVPAPGIRPNCAGLAGAGMHHRGISRQADRRHSGTSRWPVCRWFGWPSSTQ
jgi:hypothetical protein